MTIDDSAALGRPPHGVLSPLLSSIAQGRLPRISIRRTRKVSSFDGWGFLWQPALLGFLALVAITVGTSFPDSPFKHPLPGTWFFGMPRTTPLASAPVNASEILAGVTLVYGGLVLLIRVWIRLADIARQHPGAPVARLGWILTLWVLPMLVIAPIFSRDVYSYAAQGEMVTRHINPYTNGPQTLGSGPYPGPVDPIWNNVPAPYGPLFLSLDGWIVQLSGHRELWTIVGLRLLEVAAVALLAWSLPVLARARGYDPGNAFIMCLLNPLVVLTLVGGAHNDALMVALLVAGLALAARRHPMLGIAVCALGASIKAPACIGILYIAWEWRGPGTPVRQRLAPLAAAGAITAAVLAVCTLIAGLGVGWVDNLLTPGTVRSWAAPATGLGMGAAALLHAVGVHASTNALIAASRGLGLAAAGVLALWLLFNADRIGWLKALGYSLLAVVVLGPVVQPWYLAWGVLLLAPIAVGRLRGWMIALSVVSPFIGLPGGRPELTSFVNAPTVEAGFVLVLLWAVLFAPLGKWTTYDLVPRGADAGPS